MRSILNHAYVDYFSSVQLLSHVQLCDPMHCRMPGLSVHHQLPELTQTNVLWVRDAVQPSHPLSSPPPPALSLSQHQGFFKWVLIVSVIRFRSLIPFIFVYSVSKCSNFIFKYVTIQFSRHHLLSFLHCITLPPF